MNWVIEKLSGFVKVNSMSRSWEQIVNDLCRVQSMRRTPRNMHKVPDGQVFDADKSVRWNREQVLRNNEKYYDEVKRLTLEKNLEQEKVLSYVYEKIQEDVGYGVSREKAKIIWNFAYGETREYGIGQTIMYLEDLIGLLCALLEDE